MNTKIFLSWTLLVTIIVGKNIRSWQPTACMSYGNAWEGKTQTQRQRQRQRQSVVMCGWMTNCFSYWVRLEGRPAPVITPSSASEFPLAAHKKTWRVNLKPVTRANIDKRTPRCIQIVLYSLMTQEMLCGRLHTKRQTLSVQIVRICALISSICCKDIFIQQQKFLNLHKEFGATVQKLKTPSHELCSEWFQKLFAFCYSVHSSQIGDCNQHLQS